MSQDNSPNQTHDDDADGHRAAFGTEPGFASLGTEPGFVVDVPSANDEDDAEGHLSGARHVEPGIPSAAGDLRATNPKAAEDPEAF